MATKKVRMASKSRFFFSSGGSSPTDVETFFLTRPRVFFCRDLIVLSSGVTSSFGRVPKSSWEGFRRNLSASRSTIKTSSMASASSFIAGTKWDSRPTTKGIGAQQKYKREGGRTGINTCCHWKGYNSAKAAWEHEDNVESDEETKTTLRSATSPVTNCNMCFAERHCKSGWKSRYCSWVSESSGRRNCHILGGTLPGTVTLTISPGSGNSHANTPSHNDVRNWFRPDE